MTDEPWSLEALLAYVRRYEAQIRVRVEIEGQWQNAWLKDLPPELWAEQVANFMVRGSVPPHETRDTDPLSGHGAGQAAASEGETFEAGA
jgi:hypothetical protein